MQRIASLSDKWALERVIVKRSHEIDEHGRQGDIAAQNSSAAISIVSHLRGCDVTKILNMKNLTEVN